MNFSLRLLLGWANIAFAILATIGLMSDGSVDMYVVLLLVLMAASGYQLIIK